jgi:fibronectin type 3 domain-containing protein
MKTLIAFFVLLAGSAFAGSVTLAWDASPSPGVTGYNIYYGTVSGQYTHIVEGIGLDLGVLVPGLRFGGVYYFVVTAFDQYGIESDYSNECRAKILKDEPLDELFEPATLEQ